MPDWQSHPTAICEAESIGADARDILREIRALDGTIRARLLYQRA